MIKFFIILFFICILCACAQQPPKIVYQTVNIPVYVTPAPPKVQKPDLYINHLTPYQQTLIGELAKGFRISLTQDQQYICILETIINKYDELSKQPQTTIAAQSVALTDKEQQTCNDQ